MLNLFKIRLIRTGYPEKFIDETFNAFNDKISQGHGHDTCRPNDNDDL